MRMLKCFLGRATKYDKVKTAPIAALHTSIRVLTIHETKRKGGIQNVKRANLSACHPWWTADATRPAIEVLSLSSSGVKHIHSHPPNIRAEILRLQGSFIPEFGDNAIRRPKSARREEACHFMQKKIEHRLNLEPDPKMFYRISTKTSG